ncbi:MAG: hypothetical protein ACYS9X_15580 [Planctomycetota bacterium]
MPDRTIYITHCSGEKDDALTGTGRAVAPDDLYTSARFRSFVRACRKAGVAWAVLSDRYGVWLSDETREWYEKAPEDVSGTEFRALVEDFGRKLAGFGRIRFYHEPGRLHPLYRRIVEASALRDRVEFFTDLRVIR